MKKKALAIIFSALLLTGCGMKDEVKDSAFHLRKVTEMDLEDYMDGTLYVHEETGVLYLYCRAASDRAGMTALLKADGTAYTYEDYCKDQELQYWGNEREE